MKVLSLDIASITGYALWDAGVLLEAGEVRRAYRRMRRYVKRVYYPEGVADSEPLPEPDTWKLFTPASDPFSWPEHLVIEAPFVGRNPKTGLSLGERHGRIIAYLGFESYTRITKYEPDAWREKCFTLGAQWPKRLAGEKHGEALKAEAMRLVLKHWKASVPHDVAEAILAGHAFNLSPHAPYTLPKSYPGLRK